MLVAVLYVLLAVGGPLVHSHTAALDDDPLSIAQVVADAPHGPALAASTAAHSGLDHCPYCDWQANSVSGALPLQAVTLPVAVVPQGQRLVASVRSASPLSFSPRGPPLA